MTSQARPTPSSRGRCFDHAVERGVREHLFCALAAAGGGQCEPARGVLERRRAEADRIAARTRVGASAEHEAARDARAHDHEQQLLHPAPGAEARLRERRGAHVALDHRGTERPEGAGDVHVAPLERLRRAHVSLEVDQLADADADRQALPPGCQPLCQGDAVGQHCIRAALGPRPPLEPRLDGARVRIDHPGCDLRAAHIDADRVRHGR